MGRKSRSKGDRRQLERRSEDRAPANPNQTQTPQFVARFQGTMFQGPLPPPEILSRYNDAVPGAADRIIQMAERNQEHRQKLEAKVIPARARSETRGQVFGFLIALAAIASGTYLIAIDKDVLGLSVILADVAALVGTFLYVDIRKRKDLDAKR